MSTSPAVLNVERSLQDVAKVLKEFVPTGDEDIQHLKLSLNLFLTRKAITQYLPEPSNPTPTDTPTQPQPHLDKAIADIQSNIQSLTKAISALHSTPSPPKNPPTAQQGTGRKPKPLQQTYANKASSGDTRASLTLRPDTAIRNAEARPTPSTICNTINTKLYSSTHHQVRLSAVKWTASGNLILVGAPQVTEQHLQNASSLIATAFAEAFTDHISPNKPIPAPPIRPNIKWSRLIISSVPTGVSDSRGAFKPEECHATLVSDNPAYASLLITQKPSWVRTPSAYLKGSCSSLSVAFEDVDGSKAKTLLATRHLYAFGTRVTIKKWKNHTRTHTTATTKTTTTENVAPSIKPLIPPTTRQQKPSAPSPLGTGSRMTRSKAQAPTSQSRATGPTPK